MENNLKLDKFKIDSNNMPFYITNGVYMNLEKSNNNKVRNDYFLTNKNLFFKIISLYDK